MIFLISNTKSRDKSVVNLGVCEIKFFKFSADFSDFDALIITSKNGVKSLKFNKIAPKFGFRVFAIGKATKKAALKYGFSDIFTPQNSHGSEFLKEILPQIKNKKILIIAPKDAALNFDEILNKNGVSFQKIIAYENRQKAPKNTPKPPKNSVLIFTSPKNALFFTQIFGWESSYKAVAIGATTAEFLEKFTTPKIAPAQNIAECVKMAKSLENSSQNLGEILPKKSHENL